MHSHYWLSGQVGWLAADRWGVPLVHSMHTMARVKNLLLADGRQPRAARPRDRRGAGRRGRRPAGGQHRRRRPSELVDLYDADPGKVARRHPGVDLELFTPGDQARGPRASLGLPGDAVVLLFVGRIQPLKAPDVLLRAAAELLAGDPELRDAAGRRRRRRAQRVRPRAARRTCEELAAELGVDDVVRFVPPVARPELAEWYRAADLVVVPSYSESFGLVALEAQACGTPVVAAAVGGLRTAVATACPACSSTGHDPATGRDAVDSACWSTPAAAQSSSDGALPPRRAVRLAADRRPACSRCTPRPPVGPSADGRLRRSGPARGGPVP